MMCCVTKATPIRFITGNKLKSCRMGLTNHTQPVSHHITPLVINALEGRHTDTHTHTYRRANKNNFKKSGTRFNKLKIKQVDSSLCKHQVCISSAEMNSKSHYLNSLYPNDQIFQLVFWILISIAYQHQFANFLLFCTQFEDEAN